MLKGCVECSLNSEKFQKESFKTDGLFYFPKSPAVQSWDTIYGLWIKEGFASQTHGDEGEKETERESSLSLLKHAKENVI